MQLVPIDELAILALENLTKSLALSARELALHWVIEAEYPNRLAFTLKPRFHRSVDAIDASQLRAAQADLERLRRSFDRDARLSWWKRR